MASCLAAQDTSALLPYSPCSAGTNLLNGHIIAIKFVRIVLHTHNLPFVWPLARTSVYDVVPNPPYRSPARAMHHNYETNIVRTEYSKGALVSHRRITTGQKAFIMYSALTSLGPISRTCLISCVSCLHGFFHDSRALLMLCHIFLHSVGENSTSRQSQCWRNKWSVSPACVLVLLLNSRDRSSGYNVYTKRISSIGKLFSFKLDIELTCHVRCRLAISNPVRVNVPYPDCLN